ncbi:S9 family peptidase [candidate division CSSED10-310 bacterium]|uniref:S9 family peptidase n=1 Tax=candidate division CSSED10-310 bacterium TaxID=2855610 RepID=A0ABV6Z0B6_UNCC1
MLEWKKYLIILVGALFMYSVSTVLASQEVEVLKHLNRNEQVAPPVAQKIPHTTTYHGQVLHDDYHWLKDKSRKSKAVLDYIAAENLYTEKMTAHCTKLQQEIYQEMVSKIKETDWEVPVRIDNYFYYKRTEKGKQYPIHCRKKDSLEAPEEIILDVNEVAKNHDYFDLGYTRVSPDHCYLAYTVDLDGSEIQTLYIKDLRTGSLLKDTIQRVGSLAWANDNKTIFYDLVDEAKRSYKIYRHELGTDLAQDVMLYHEKDEAFYIWVEKTRSKAYLIIGTGSQITSEIRILKADTPREKLTLIQPREKGVQYYVQHHGDFFYILTNIGGAKNFKIMTAPINAPIKDNWLEFRKEQESAYINECDMFRQYMVLQETDDGLQKICIIDLKSKEEHYLPFPEPIYCLWSKANPTFDSTLFRFGYSSLVTPDSVFDYNMHTRTMELKKQDEVRQYDSSRYHSERIFAQAKDGTSIPVSLVYKKDSFHKDGSNALVLEAYGAYGVSSDPYFSSIRLSLLDRNFVYAIAHVRGGREYGEEWYEQGRLLNKKNTFTDFISCAEQLIKEKYTAQDKLVIYGGSAGGLLMGAVTNLRPDLFKIVIAGVPFVDMLNTMLDPSLTSTVVEYDEWGNPNEKKYFDYMRSYCPYQNVKAQSYPHMIILAGFYDPRVNYWEPAKWTAKLRALKTDQNLILLKTEMSGHGGASGRYDILLEYAFLNAVVFDLLGIKH